VSIKRRHPNFKDFTKELLKDPEVKAAYDLLQPDYAVVEAFLKVRKENDWTQAQLAEKLACSKNTIYKLEGGLSNPSIKFLKRAARSLNCNLEIRFRAC